VSVQHSYVIAASAFISFRLDPLDQPSSGQPGGSAWNAADNVGHTPLFGTLSLRF
jgi:hypothetical protein